MKTPKANAPATPEQNEAAKIHRHEALVDAELTAAGGVSGAAIGAMIGSIGGPPGAIAGAIVGGAIGAASGYAVEVDHHRDSRHDHELDDAIGVTSGNLGARSTKHAPREADGAPREKPPTT